MNDVGISVDDGDEPSDATPAMPSERAAEYASWFRCLSDPTRIRILNLVSITAGPMTVGEIVERIGKSQSTVSRHLRLLAEDEFIVTVPDGIRTLISVDPSCMAALPDAARAIMGVIDPPPP